MKVVSDCREVQPPDVTSTLFVEMEVHSVTQEDANHLNLLVRELRWDWSRNLTIENIVLVLSSGTTVFVAKDAELDRIVGTASLSVDRQLTGLNCRVQNVVVASEYRRRGISESIMQLVLGSLPASVTTIELSSGNSRPEAHALYKKLGFEPIGTLHFKLNIMG